LALKTYNVQDRLAKLLDIWVNTKTFPLQMLQDFKQRLYAPAQRKYLLSYSNVKTPISHFDIAQPTFNPAPMAAMPPAPAPAPTPAYAPTLAPASSFNDSTNSLLAAFGAPPPPAPVQAASQLQPPAQAGAANPDTNALFAALSGFMQQSGAAAPSQHHMPAPQPAQHIAQPNPAVNFPIPSQAFGQLQLGPVASQVPFPGSSIPPPAPAPVANANPLAALLQPQGGNLDPNALASQIQLLQAVSQQLGPDGLKTLVAALGIPQLPLAAPAPAPAPATSAPAVTPFQPPLAQYSHDMGVSNSANGQSYGGGRDAYSYNPRARSRSPDFKRRRHSPPNRRDSPTYGTYDPGAVHNGGGPHSQDDDRSRRGRKGGLRNDRNERNDRNDRNDRNERNEYRQRTPPGGREDDYPLPPNHQPKPVGYDPKVPEGRIKGKATDMRCK
jgi:protein NRD1